ncbi:MAG: T9SS type A sorting domain-containing protein [bacterium]
MYINILNMKKLIISLFVLLPNGVFCQSITEPINISGNISTESTPVQNVLITFVDEANLENTFNAITDTLGNYFICIITSVENPEPIIPANIELAQNYPNPFSNSTTISYKTNEPEAVTIKIYDILGREIKTLVTDEISIGTKGITWDGRNNFGTMVTPGVYFYLMKAGKEILVKKMLVNHVENNIATPQLNNCIPPEEIQVKKHLSTRTGNYKVVVQSDTNTFPLIVKQEFPATIISTDTTMNFEVEKARIIMGKSIDGVKMGDDSDTVIDLLGEPDSGFIGNFDGFGYCYNDENLNNVLTITFFDTSSNHTSEPTVVYIEPTQFYKGKTREGVKMGMLRDDVIRLLGEPDGSGYLVDGYHTEQFTGYLKTGITLFYNEQNYLTDMRMFIWYDKAFIF